MNTVSASKQQPLVWTVSAQDTKNEWVLDSGCSFHITSQREVLFDFKEVNGGKVLMENNTQCDVEGIGKTNLLTLLEKKSFSLMFDICQR